MYMFVNRGAREISCSLVYAIPDPPPLPLSFPVIPCTPEEEGLVIGYGCCCCCLVFSNLLAPVCSTYELLLVERVISWAWDYTAAAYA